PHSDVEQGSVGRAVKTWEVSHETELSYRFHPDRAARGDYDNRHYGRDPLGPSPLRARRLRSMRERIALEGGTPIRAREDPLPSLSPRDLGPNVRRYVEEVLASGFTADHTARFERAWAAACGTKHAVGIDNCTSAIHTAVAAVGVEPGDHVVVSAIS